MGLLKILGLGQDKVTEQPKPTTQGEKNVGENPHENGGCCGGCGSK